MIMDLRCSGKKLTVKCMTLGLKPLIELVDVKEFYLKKALGVRKLISIYFSSTEPYITLIILFMIAD